MKFDQFIYIYKKKKGVQVYSIFDYKLFFI